MNRTKIDGTTGNIVQAAIGRRAHATSDTEHILLTYTCQHCVYEYVYQIQYHSIFKYFIAYFMNILNSNVCG